MATPRALGWGAPGVSRSNLVKLDLPLEPVPMYVRAEVAPLFRELFRWLDAERRRLGRPLLSSSGGYAFRPVRGYEERYTRTRNEALLSNHSWGTAVDVNAGTNPMQNILRTDMPPGTGAKARSLGLEWGGDWPGRKDPMHFQVDVSPARARQIVASLVPDEPAKPAPEPSTFDAEPLMAALPLLEMPADYPATQNTHPNVLTLHALLFAAAKVGLVDFGPEDVDGNFGPGTKAAVQAYQRYFGFDPDGIVGPITWRRLLALSE
jgi:hypothetical protein